MEKETFGGMVAAMRREKGMTQAELMPLYDGLEHEISRCPADVEWPVNERMDSFLAARK